MTNKWLRSLSSSAGGILFNCLGFSHHWYHFLKPLFVFRLVFLFWSSTNWLHRLVYSCVIFFFLCQWELGSGCQPYCLVGLGAASTEVAVSTFEDATGSPASSAQLSDKSRIGGIGKLSVSRASSALLSASNFTQKSSSSALSLDGNCF